MVQLAWRTLSLVTVLSGAGPAFAAGSPAATLIPGGGEVAAALVGAVLGLIGGGLAALLSWGEQDFSLRAAVRMVGLGVGVGVLLRLGLIDVTNHSNGWKMLIVGFGAFVAEQILTWVKRVARRNPGGLVAAALRGGVPPVIPPAADGGKTDG